VLAGPGRSRSFNHEGTKTPSSHEEGREAQIYEALSEMDDMNIIKGNRSGSPMPTIMCPSFCGTPW
jgi:hypothetical protein